MNLNDALNEIQSRTKAYEQLTPPMLQGTFSNTVKSIRHGFAKPKTIEQFMAKFGYTKSVEQWEKR